MYKQSYRQYDRLTTDMTDIYIGRQEGSQQAGRETDRQTDRL